MVNIQHEIEHCNFTPRRRQKDDYFKLTVTWLRVGSQDLEWLTIDRTHTDKTSLQVIHKKIRVIGNHRAIPFIG